MILKHIGSLYCNSINVLPFSLVIIKLSVVYRWLLDNQSANPLAFLLMFFDMDLWVLDGLLGNLATVEPVLAITEDVAAPEVVVCATTAVFAGFLFAGSVFAVSAVVSRGLGVIGAAEGACVCFFIVCVCVSILLCTEGGCVCLG